MTKIEIITRPEKLEALKESMNKIGVTGMTVSQVLGYGLQKGHREVYRGTEYNVNLVPKVKIEIGGKRFGILRSLVICLSSETKKSTFAPNARNPLTATAVAVAPSAS